MKTSSAYVKRDFLLGGTFSSLDDMSRQILSWLNRVNAAPHGTTNEIPFERLRQEHLKSLATILPYRLRREERRKISREAFVSCLGNRYSVPYCTISPYFEGFGVREIASHARSCEGKAQGVATSRTSRLRVRQRCV